MTVPTDPTTPVITTTTVERVWNADHSWNFERIVRVEGRGLGAGIKLRTVIRRNAHDSQSGARLYHWSGGKWQRLLDRDISELRAEVRALRYAQKGVTLSDFNPTADDLQAVAIEIIRS